MPIRCFSIIGISNQLTQKGRPSVQSINRFIPYWIVRRTIMPAGFMGKILFVDLSTGEMEDRDTGRKAIS